MTLSEAELIRWGRRIGETLESPAFIGLSGELGAGKSVLARAIGAGAGVEEPMPSPTFTLLQRYPARGGRQLVHLDLYRVASPAELWELGWAQLGDEDEIVLVEWPERAGTLLPPDRWTVELRVAPGHPELREVEITRTGSPPELVGFPISVAGP
ncbi:MAG TPA: tRNA (adenosine(37)-N6)-threonylcarbamoyltransferase complex ATPase subunit type 1 TsaE [Longimicrobiales bacterium]|nr:tRNA (adenosine(37)-N6)-threonylcarbamoyltransferase complex ATPase subunit type 1 TsaE [Longimicrobiales bacterium]